MTEPEASAPSAAKANIVTWPPIEETKEAFEAYVAAVGEVAYAWNYLHERHRHVAMRRARADYEGYGFSCGPRDQAHTRPWRPLASLPQQELTAIFLDRGDRIRWGPAWYRPLEFQPVAVEQGLDPVPDAQRMDQGFTWFDHDFVPRSRPDSR